MHLVWMQQTGLADCQGATKHFRVNFWPGPHFERSDYIALSDALMCTRIGWETIGYIYEISFMWLLFGS